MGPDLPENRLVTLLVPEVFQSEQSAVTHCAREAKRLGSARPAAKMVAIATHATSALRALHSLAEARHYAVARHGKVVGNMLSHFRQYGLDVLVSGEKSYRGTLLGVHHGIGAVVLLECAATTLDDRELSSFCKEWLVERRALAAAAEHELSWFAENPARATASARSVFNVLR